MFNCFGGQKYDKIFNRTNFLGAFCDFLLIAQHLEPSHSQPAQASREWFLLLFPVVTLSVKRMKKESPSC